MISVILPVYNMKKTLERSVESICKQSYLNWELLIIDDGSTDGSADVADACAEREKRIRVFHIDNVGVSKARNFGISKAEGEWIAFLDGDDIYLPNAFAVMMEQGSNSDLIIGSFDIISKRHFDVGDLPDMCFQTKDLPDNHVMEQLWKNFLFAVVWNRLYRRSMLNTVFDSALEYGEDTVFNLKSFSNFSRCATLKDKTYVYTWPCNEVKPKMLRGRLEILKAISEYFPDNETMKRASVFSYAKIIRRYVAESFVYVFSPEEKLERFALCAAYANNALIRAYEKYLPEQSIAWWTQIKCGEYERVTEDFIYELREQKKPLSEVFLKIDERGKKENVLC